MTQRVSRQKQIKTTTAKQGRKSKHKLLKEAAKQGARHGRKIILERKL